MTDLPDSSTPPSDVPRRGEPPGKTPVVGIGASAGGIEALRGFFENMAPDTGLAFVVILHLPPDRKSLLPEILARWTSMRIVEAEDGVQVQSNAVYVPPPGVVVTYRDAILHLRPLDMEKPRETTPIDLFFNSLATGLREEAVGIVLSGTGSDGALGLKAIKECGGLTLAQGVDGSAPMHHGMPDSAIATGAVDLIVPVEEMPAHILAVHGARTGRNAAIDPGEPTEEDAARVRLAICAALLRHTGHDFSHYKDKTFLRRVQRRMQVLGIAELDAYRARLELDRAESAMLFRDLLIGVTSFFRDNEAFDALEAEVMPRLFEGKEHGGTIRVWVAGCSTGEEAYSLAMLLREHADRLGGVAPEMQVFATDIDEAAIATARAGRYPSVLLQGLSDERRNQFFVEGGNDSWTVAKDVRSICTFSAHSLTRDPPFSRIDLVSCRNLLIYLDVQLQDIVVPAFHYALVPDGILLLGSAETVSRHDALFAPLDRANRIFSRRDVPSPPLQPNGRAHRRDVPLIREGASPGSGTRRRDMVRLGNRASHRILERYAPAFVLVTPEGNIVQFSSRTGRYLEAASGQPTQNVFAMARRGLRNPLQIALKQAVETGRSVEKPRIPMTGPIDEARRVTLTVEPITEQGAGTLFLVVFQDAPPERPMDPLPDAVIDSPVTRQLETELADTREQLQGVTEEHETSLEELRSANEELHSVNEEMQSTNEELETSKEEIQSINEELQTANNQLSGHVEELDRRNTDLQNLFESTQVATIFLDPYLIIRGFTPAVADIYNLIPSDQGRSITDIVSQLRYDTLAEDVRTVLDGLQPLERRVVRNDDQRHYLMRILPYRTPISAVDGTIVTFVDVSTIVQAEQHQRLLVDELNHRVKNMLTVVISIAVQTMRRAASKEDFSRDFLGRVHALAAAYSLLSSEGWQRVPLRELLQEELEPFMDGERLNVTLNGPRILLPPRAALALGMAIHELTANAVKYGALSVPEGEVEVTWDLQEDSGRAMLQLAWREHGGPLVTTPATRGFGTTLLQRGLKQDMSATVELDFAPTGVTAILRAPLDPPAQAPA